MFFLSLIKLILIFPFILYIATRIYTRNKRLSYLIISPLYLVSLVLWTRYLFGNIIGLIIGLLIIMSLVYITIQMKKPIQLTNSKIARYSLINLGRMYPNIYVIFFIIGVIQEYLTIGR